MTPPREPDRFEAKAAEVLKAVMDAERRGDNMDPIIAAALRHESEDALERAAQVVEQRCYNHGPRPVSWCEYCLMATRIRALALSPEAPPAPYGLTAKAAPSQVPGPICVPQPSEPVAPAPSCTCKWRLEQSIRHAPDCPVVASPTAQGKGE